MAYSQSIRRAQTPKPCELCEVDININWKCLECRKYMCNKCKNIHAKFPAFVQHTLIDSKASGDVHEDKLTVIADNIPCQIHKKKMNVMFCRSCNVLVCSKCIASSHKQHNLDSIEKVCEEKLELVNTSIDNISVDLIFYKSEANRTEIDQAERDSKFNDTITIIDEKEKEVKEAVIKYAQVLRDKVEMERISMNKLMSDTQNKLKNALRVLENKHDTLQKAIESNQGEDILNAAANKDENFHNSQFKTPQKTFNFIPGEVNQSKVMDLFGSLEPTKIPVEVYTDLEVVQSYNTDYRFVHRLVMLGDKRAWISYSSDDILRQISIKTEIRITKEISAKIYDMALTLSGDIILSMTDSSQVKILTKAGEIKHFFSVSPLLTRGIHVTRDNDIVLGVKEYGDAFPLTDTSCRRVVVFSSDGKQTQCYEYSKYKQRLFTLPYRITTYENNIGIIDATSDTTGRVVVLGTEGDIKWSYVGYSTIDTGDTPFDPTDIVTSMGHVVVADYRAGAIHVISGEGELLMCKVMNDLGIICPYSLDIDPRGQLWVGCGTLKGKTDAKIHVMKFK